ncbi:TIR domain-containing protein [Sphaerisporangium corydalis]|uniref:TIR domain-containing protein n=1 Tax=Sphaerisporangium corydalis TaxID=1441875 RepID=A0ABV9EQ59_9ACTN|nr:TIR domain-containing protein [Sphaerisporangium corydalis]
MAYDVFLSHSLQDAEWADRLYRRLRRFRVSGRPLEIFFAPAAIGAGESIPRGLREALGSCRHLVAVVTPSWLESEWCRLEEEVVVWRDSAAVDRVLLPLLLQDCGLPSVLHRLKYIDFRRSADYERSLQEIVSAIRAGIRRSVDSDETQRQKRALLNSPILPWLNFNGPSFDFVWPEMIMDPSIKLHKHPGPETRLSRWLAQPEPFRSSCIAVVGDAGSGKTTALRTILLSGGGAFPEQRVLLQAREVGTKIDSIIAKVDRQSALTVLVDGLDEASESVMVDLARSLSRLLQLNAVVIVASRTEFFERQYPVLHPHVGELAEVVEICSWHDGDVREFSRLYAERVDDDSISAVIERIMEDFAGSRNLISNPMRLTLLLYLLAVGTRLDVVDLKEPYSLYRLFYDEWIKKERHRGTGGFDAKVIRRAHLLIARWIYRNKGDVSLLRLIVGDVVGVSLLDSLDDSAFSELLTIDRDESGEALVRGFRHETIGEFLIAQHILTSFLEGGEEIDVALDTTVADDVNVFVRSGMLEAPRRSVERCLANLTERYELLVSVDETTVRSTDHQNQADRVREQILYYIGRLPLNEIPPVLSWAFANERHPLLRRSAALSVILQGDSEIEKKYLALLDEPDEARMNRSVQMVYFGDVQADLHTFVDAGQDWSRTRAAIYRRLSGNLLRDLRLRFWDLRTLRSFYESRTYSDLLSEGERQVLVRLNLIDPSSQDRTAALSAEYQKLASHLDL